MRTIRGSVEWSAYVGSVEDAHGNEIETWADPVEVGYWRFNPGGSQEPFTPGHDRVVTQPELYYPGPAFGPYDKVTVNGVVFDVDGHAAVWEGDNLPEGGFVARLKNAEG